MNENSIIQQYEEKNETKRSCFYDYNKCDIKKYILFYFILSYIKDSKRMNQIMLFFTIIYLIIALVLLFIIYPFICIHLEVS